MDFVSKFILIEHLAKKAGKHYDLRFKKPDSKMWNSFATKKDIPTESGKKIMLIKTSLHTEEEALFVGRVTAGYGAGILTKVDGGAGDNWEIGKKPFVIPNEVRDLV